VADREWREATDLRVSPVNILLVLVVAAVVRVWGLGHGIPYAIGVDEPEILGRAVAMMKSGDFNPRFYDYPGLAIYMHVPVACARFLAGAMAGQWRSLQGASLADFFLWSRALTAIFGVATVFVLFQIGTRWGARHALLASGLLAVMPLHVRESHYVLADVPATFFVTLTFLLSLVAHERGTAKAFAWAGAAAGLTMATKYNAGIVLLLPLVAAGMTLHATPSRLRCTLAAVAGTLGAYFLAAPYTLLDLPGFLNGFANLMGYYRPRPPEAEPGWVVYLKHLRLALGWPAMLLAGIAVILGAVRAINGPGRVRWTLLLLFPAAYFAAISGRSLVFGRYLLPLVPFVCLLTAIAVISGVSLLRRFNVPRTPRRTLIAALTVATLLPPLVGAIGFNRRITRDSTHAIAFRWINQHIPAGARIAVERDALHLPEGKYRADRFVRLTDRQYDQYVGSGYQYLIATSDVFGRALQAPHALPAVYAAYRQLFDQSEQLLIVKPDEEHPGPELRIYRLRGTSQQSPASR
jgi:4-amino-4-deoxy-L-arabinose transferase-like glycosyltransferase